jgi:DnaA-homolog protein
MFQLPLNIQLDDSTRLDNFYVGENIQLFDRLKQLTSDANEMYFIWGGDEVGKSHLAQAICNELAEQDKTAVYLPLDNQQLEPAVLEGLEFADLICLDSLQSVVGSSRWEEAIFDLFNRLKQHERNLIILSQYPISSLTIKLKDLSSRLSSMEIYRLKSVAHNQQADFIKSISSHRGLEVSNDVASFLIARTERDISKMIAMIELLDKQSLAHQRKITIPFVKQILSL